MAHPERPQSILIVDDVPENLDILKEALRSRYIVQPARSGELALRIAHGNPAPDLVLLDLMMPGMDGYEVLRQLKADPRTREIPVIFVTAHNDIDSELKGFKLGAVDFIAKPYSVPVVNARVRTHLALREAKRQIEAQKDALLGERRLVESIIAHMRENAQFNPLGLRYLLSPVDGSNGDILFSALTPDGRQWLLVGDITGHGLPAAVITPLVSHIFYSQARQGVPIQDMLALLNEVMHRQLPIGLFMTASAAEIATDRRACSLWNAGMPPCLLLRDRKIVWRGEPRCLPPFGIVADNDYAAGRDEVALVPGDRLYMLSDGVTEVTNKEKHQFGIAGVERLLEASGGEGLPATLHAALEAHRGDTCFQDDITFLESSF